MREANQAFRKSLSKKKSLENVEQDVGNMGEKKIEAKIMDIREMFDDIGMRNVIEITLWIEPKVNDGGDVGKRPSIDFSKRVIISQQ
jgi:hypothetical protein